jgi:7-cyano-7-deazaguanine synthase in queuosine biosynthesis
MIKPRLVLCSGTQVREDDLLREGRHVVELDALGPDPNVNLRLENVSDAFARLIEKRFVDLLEIAAYVYAADCEARREGAWIDDSTEQWDRDFHFVVPVRDVGFWQREDVRERLILALNFLSGDRLAFTFLPLRKQRLVSGYLETSDIEDLPFYGVERVTLFSGGLDSLAGAVESVARGERLVAVSHRSAQVMNKRQKELFRLLQERFPTPMMHVPVWVNKSESRRESSQRTRTFLFSALAATVGSVLRAGGVRVYENGVTSLNLPLAPEVLQSRASRSTHPESLRRLEEFFRLVTENGAFVVDNPFIFDTKAEVVAKIAANGACELIGHTCSCTRTMFQTRNQWHCGRCGQCIDRRIAVLATGQKKHDSEDDYGSGVFTGPRKEAYEHNIAVNYARFASEIHGMTEKKIGDDYCVELARATRRFDRQAEAAERFIQMHKRHAQSVCEVLAVQMKIHSRDFVEGKVDPTSLLGVIGRERHVAQTAAPDAEPAATDAGQNIFRCDGDKRTVAYQGVTRYLDEIKGMRYMAHLLRSPGRPFSAQELIWAVDGRPDAPGEATPPGEELQNVDDGSGVSVYTDDEIRDLKRRLVRESRQREQAIKDGNTTKATELKESIDAIRGLLSPDLDKFGRSRLIDSRAEAARKDVSKYLHRVLERLEKHHPQLHSHLKVTLTIGAVVAYTPDADPRWIT